MSFLRPEKLTSRVILSFLLIVIPITIGVIGYMTIEDFNFLDALYMSVITIATVGFGETNPLSDAGRIFTIFLIISNLGIFAYALSLITSILIQGDFFEKYKSNKMKQQIAKLNNHVILCGYGRTGKEAAEILNRKKIPFVVIESRKDLNDELQANGIHWYLNEDATKDEVLEDAGIKKARGLITTLPDDADNVYVVLTAREINSEMTIISRASTDSSVKKLKRAGASNVIMPDKIGGAHMASLITQPDVKEFLDIISGQGEGVQLEEIELEKIAKQLNGNTIAELNLRHKTGVNVIGLKNTDGSYTVNPDIFTVLPAGTKLIVLGTAEQMEALKVTLNK
ncbi:MAG: potassium channel protein [Bacteroidetes bacterium]|nr:MAG: potassium channel protein [Bacteroidota bacterium]